MNFVEAISVLVAIVVAIIGWYLAIRAIADQQRKQLRLGHLIETYFLFRELETTGINSKEDFHRLLRAINTFYLLGDHDQIVAMDRFVENYNATRAIQFDDINRLIVGQIRRELHLPFFKGKYGVAITRDQSAS